MSAETEIEGALGRVIRRMTSTLEPREVLAEITRGLVGELDAALARVWLVGPGDLCATCALAPSCPHRTRCLHLVASAGLSERLDGKHRRVPFGALKIGRIAETREPLCVNDLLGDPRIEDQEWVQREGLRSFGGYALTFRDDLLGVLAMFGKRPLSSNEIERLGVFAAHASVALKNAQLFEQVSRLSERLEEENTYLKEELREGQPASIVGESPAIQRARSELARVAPTPSTVLVLGETGTGKELFARALHDLSPRRAGPLVKVSCAAIAPALIESELFGHEKGAFTGATQRRIGRFELADGGTLFLDEVGELPLEAQAKLLRVVQERELERVGSARPVPIDVRLVCATNRDLAVEVREHRFRADLYYRLRVFPIDVPPLRARLSDVPLLVAALLPALSKRVGRVLRGVDDEAMRALSAYDWPGNVRELQNVLERAAIVARGPRVTLEDLPDLAASLEPEPQVETGNDAGDEETPSLRARVSAFEKSLIAEALGRAGGNQVDAARLLRMRRTTLQYKMKLYAL